MLKIYIKLINEIESEEVILSLESIISMFPDEVHPFALEISKFLIDTFEQATNKAIENPNEQTTLSAVSALNTITKIIDIFNKDTESLIKLSFDLKPILEMCLKTADYYEEGINLLNCLLFYTSENTLTHLFHLLFAILTSLVGNNRIQPFGFQFIENVFPSIGNFIQKYKPLTLENLEFILNCSFSLLKISEDEIYLGSQILISLLEYYKGLLDRYVKNIINEAFQAFVSKISRKYKIACSQIILAAF